MKLPSTAKLKVFLKDRVNIFCMKKTYQNLSQYRPPKPFCRKLFISGALLIGLLSVACQKQATQTDSEAMKSFIEQIPKAELHVHLEGTIEPAMTMDMARRNQIDFPYKTQ